MIRWNVGANDVYKEATVYREEGPWWAFFVEKSLELLNSFLGWTHRIPLPNLPISKDSMLEGEFLEENEVVTLKSYYGNLYYLLRLRVHDPIYEWCWSKYTITSATMDISDVPQEWIPWVKEWAEDEPFKFGDEEKDKLYCSFLNVREGKQILEDDMGVIKEQILSSFRK